MEKNVVLLLLVLTNELHVNLDVSTKEMLNVLTAFLTLMNVAILFRQYKIPAETNLSNADIICTNQLELIATLT
jgi:hypothetical protein